MGQMGLATLWVQMSSPNINTIEKNVGNTEIYVGFTGPYVRLNKKISDFHMIVLCSPFFSQKH